MPTLLTTILSIFLTRILLKYIYSSVVFSATCKHCTLYIANSLKISSFLLNVWYDTYKFSYQWQIIVVKISKLKSWQFLHLGKRHNFSNVLEFFLVHKTTAKSIFFLKSWYALISCSKNFDLENSHHK